MKPQYGARTRRRKYQVKKAKAIRNANILTETMDVGHIADEGSLLLSYTQSKVTNLRIAVGVIKDGQPRLVLL